MAKRVFLEFEHDIEAFEKKVDELRELAENTSESAVAVSIDAEVAQLENKSRELLKKVYADLTPWQMSLVARHPNRPYTLDYIDMMFTDFQEVHGDRAFADDEAIVGGLARLADMNVIVIGNQKGRTLRERTRRNFGMARPEGYRKALRLMKLAEKFKEKPEVCNAIGAHHDEVEMTSIISPIIQVCDAISGARPGARREVVESYIKRLKEMEDIALSYPGVVKTYAIQAGRELRVIVGADKLSDQESEGLSHDIAKKIQDEMTYPGQVKITVIRETRAVSYAK